MHRQVTQTKWTKNGVRTRFLLAERKAVFQPTLVCALMVLPKYSILAPCSRPQVRLVGAWPEFLNSQLARVVCFEEQP